MLSMAKPAKNKVARHHVKGWRLYRHLTQERLAERVGRSRGLISQIESGETELTEEMIFALSDALSCDPWDLLRVDPRKEGAVIDLVALLKNADPKVRDEILDFAAYKLGKTGTSN